MFRHDTDHTKRLTFDEDGRARRVALKELEDKQICRVLAARNQDTSGTLEICPEYWPYVTEGSSEASPAPDQESYVEAVGKIFLAEPCVPTLRFWVAVRMFIASKAPTSSRKEAVTCPVTRTFFSTNKTLDTAPERGAVIR